MKYLVIELNSGLVEGYYKDFDDADSYARRHQRRRKDLNFTVSIVEDDHVLKDEELLRYADWFSARRKNA